MDPELHGPKSQLGYLLVYVWPWAGSLCLNYLVSEILLKCQTLCLAITNFLHLQGLERTIRDNFGGGNTAWEEEKLSKYKDR